MFYLIYKITNTANRKYYIGAHKTLNKNDGYMGSGSYLKNAQNKHGIDNFIKEILCECSSEEEMYLKEKELVTVSNDTYNLKEGGEGGWDYINNSGSNNKNRQCVKGGKIGGKRCHELKVGIHSPDFIRPPQKKIIEDEDMLNSYLQYRNVSKALVSLGLARTGGSRRRMEKIIAALV